MSPEKKWRYPGQAERYRESPATEDYEKLLGHASSTCPSRTCCS